MPKELIQRPGDVPEEKGFFTVSSSTARSSATRGQSQSAIIWREFRKRRLAVAAAVVILFLTTTSIFAPFLANEAPIYYFGFNRFEYQEAGRNLRAMVKQIIETRSNTTPVATAERLIKSIPLQIEIMSRPLPAEKATLLRDMGNKLVAAAKSSDSASVDEMNQLLRTIRSDFDLSQVTLSPQAHWPVVMKLNGLDVGFMLANILLLLFPLWNLQISRLFTDEMEHRRNWCRCLILVGLPAIAGLAWWWNVSSRVDWVKYKEKGALAASDDANKADVVFQSVVWPPLAYGVDEHVLAEKWIAPVFYPKSKDAEPFKPTSPWSGPHWLGTDSLGRDVLCRMIWGGRISLSVGLVAVSIYVAIGIVVGAIAGYFRGICDLVISRLIEVMICFPTFFLILTIVAFFGPSVLNIMIIIGLTGWTGIARLVRGEFLRLVDQEFVLAGRALGYSPARIIFRHVLPNAMAPVLVSATFGIAGGILTESALSFLGLGVSKPTPSWGSLLFDGRADMEHAPWLIHFPGLAIFIVITAYNLMGEALRDASDPRMRGMR